MKKRFLANSAAFLATGALFLAGLPTAGAVGIYSPASHPSVVYLTFPLSNGEFGLCSGTLVDPIHVVSAAHCLGASANAAGNTYTASELAHKIQVAAPNIEVDKENHSTTARPSPNYVESVAAVTHPTNDLMVLTLASQPEGVVPARIAPHLPAPGSELKICGRNHVHSQTSLDSYDYSCGPSVLNYWGSFENINFAFAFPGAYGAKGLKLNELYTHNVPMANENALGPNDTAGFQVKNLGFSWTNQVTGLIASGDSGGGVFNSEGEFVGVISTTVNGAALLWEHDWFAQQGVKIPDTRLTWSWHTYQEERDAWLASHPSSPTPGGTSPGDANPQSDTHPVNPAPQPDPIAPAPNPFPTGSPASPPSPSNTGDGNSSNSPNSPNSPASPSPATQPKLNEAKPGDPTLSPSEKTLTKIAQSPRVAGADRYETATNLFTQMPRTGKAILTTGTSAADGLGATQLSGALGGSGLLLTHSEALPEKVARTLRETGVREVFLVGGTSAISPRVETQLKDLGIKVTRIAGVDRFDTAAQVAQLTLRLYQGQGKPISNIYAADGQNFPDALAAGAKAAATNSILLLTKGSAGFNDSSHRVLSSLPEVSIVAVGGRARTAVAGIKTHEVIALVGKDRYATARALAPTTKKILMVSGSQFADALAGGAFAAAKNYSLILSGPINQGLPANLSLMLVGGSKALSNYEAARALT